MPVFAEPFCSAQQTYLVRSKSKYRVRVKHVLNDVTLRDCKNSLRDAFQCIAQPNTTLLDCILYQMQYPYDPGTLTSSAN